jgi:hypothetical protein
VEIHTRVGRVLSSMKCGSMCCTTTQQLTGGHSISLDSRKTPQIILQALVDPLRLTISLRVVCSAILELDIKRFEQILPQKACENPISISDDQQW